MNGLISVSALALGLGFAAPAANASHLTSHASHVAPPVEVAALSHTGIVIDPSAPVGNLDDPLTLVTAVSHSDAHPLTAHA